MLLHSIPFNSPSNPSREATITPFISQTELSEGVKNAQLKFTGTASKGQSWPSAWSTPSWHHLGQQGRTLISLFPCKRERKICVRGLWAPENGCPSAWNLKKIFLQGNAHSSRGEGLSSCLFFLDLDINLSDMFFICKLLKYKQKVFRSKTLFSCLCFPVPGFLNLRN